MSHAFACWTAKNATDVIPTEALAGDDAIFLATHTPMTGFDVEGPLRAEIASPDEQAVLEGLSRDDRNHAFCVVQGEPGSGKSHLIRWLSVQWPHGRDVKLLLRRADGSLEGALRQLKERLPAEFQPLFDNLGQKHRASSQGRANIFLSTLADTLENGHFDPPLDDEVWCRDKKPASLLRFQPVRSGWVAPSRILGLLEGAGGQRNSETADFNLFDIEDLARHCVTLKGSGVPPATEELARRLMHEAYTIEEWRAQGWSAEEIGQQVPNKVAWSLEFIEVLNRRRNDAIQNVLGVSAAGLKTLFRQVREALAKRNQRLVLLLEDITSWEGLDDSLIDVLTFNAEVRGDEAEGDVCPLISVVGVTPAYRVKLQGNYRGRITHEIQLGRVTKELQDVATLRDRPARLSFAAKYLAAVRAGPVRLDQWAEHLAAEPDLPAPNQCMGCNRREDCVRTFGEVDEISLFPFTAQALDRLYDSLKESDNGLTWKTPRGMLQAVLLPSLAEPDLLDQGLYPGVGIEPQPFQDHRRADQVLSANQLSAIIETQMVQHSAADRARMRRALAYWGDPETAETTEIDGGLALAGASQRLLTAFDLPWIGRDEATEIHQPAQAAETAPPESEEAPPPAPTAASPDAPAGLLANALRLSPAPRAAPSTAPPKPKGPTRTELERLREELRTWTPERPISNLSDWNKTLHLLIKNIDARSIGLAPSVLDRIVTLEMVKLEGTTSRQRNYLSIGPESWIRSGLEAYVAFKEPGGVKSSSEADYNRRKLSSMIRRLAGVVSDYADRRLGVMSDGRRWSPVGSLAQVLLARAWLRGAVSPDAPWSEQLQAAVKDEDPTEADPRARSKPWQDFLTATNQWHERFRAELRRAIDLSLGDGQGVADLTEVAGAIMRLRETLVFDLTPADAGDVNVLEYDTVRRIVKDMRDELARIGRIEHDQLIDRGQRLIDFLNGRGVVEHLGQVDQVISGVSVQIPEIAIEKVADWKRRLDRIKPRFDDGSPERSEELLFSLMGGDGAAPTDKGARLGWLAQAPARDIEDYRELSAVGDQALLALLKGAQDLIGAGGSSSLAQVHQTGGALRAVLEKTRAALSSEVA